MPSLSLRTYSPMWLQCNNEGNSNDKPYCSDWQFTGHTSAKVLIEEAQLADEDELQAEPGRIVIRRGNRPRAGWAAAARRMRERDEDRLLDPTTPTRFDQKEWKWR